MLDTSPENDPQGNSPATNSAAVAILLRLIGIFAALRAWAYGHWIRSVAIAVTILSLIAVTMAAWAYLASVALRAGELSLEPALAALDEGNMEEARALVGRMLKSGLLPTSEFGGPLYVLGAVKVNDAQQEMNSDRRRTEYLVAARYLKEARTYGIPADREQDGIFKLGQSLVETGQFDEGLRILGDLLAEPQTTDERLRCAARQLIAETYLSMPQPDVEQALQQNTALLSSDKLSAEQRGAALLRHAECHSRLGNFQEGRSSLDAIAVDSVAAGLVEVARAKLILNEIETARQKAVSTDTAATVDSAADLLAAIRLLETAVAKERSPEVTRQSSFLLGRAYYLQGDRDKALKQHMRTRQLFDETYEGTAAILAEADLLREKGDIETAVLAYRRALESIESVAVWRSVVLPLPQVRQQMMVALRDLVGRRHFEDALILIENFNAIFTQSERLELRGSTLQRWGEMLLSAVPPGGPHAVPQRKLGLEKLRASGVAYEQLAELRFATPHYTDDLWHSAENYFAGHSFTSAIRVLDKYLDYEPELRNAQALLRMGQAYLAVGKIPKSIAAFEECIEFYPLDSSTFQARIDCAKAYWHEGKMPKAEQLLRENITGSSLKPSSREWKDSLFELGMLLHETGQHEQAIFTLEEAIARYPSDPQRLAAQYVVAESYRRWAKELLVEAGEARTSSEREKSGEHAESLLTSALKHFEEVQVSITLKSHDLVGDPLLGTMLRNCYMLEGTVLFDLGRFKEAIEAYSNVASLYPDNPFVLETFVQIANCWRRLGQDNKARGAITQAQIVLDNLPPNADFSSTTALNREEWGMLLADMSKW